MTSPTSRPAGQSATEQLPEGPLRSLAQAAWQLLLFAGLVSLVLGVVVLVWPTTTLRVVGVVFGIYLLIAGVIQLAAAFGTHVSTALRVMAFIAGALSIMLGLISFRGAEQSLLLLALWIGISWLFRGITQLVAAFSDPQMQARGWHIFSGAISIVGAVVVMEAPFTTLTVLAVFSGIWLVVMGVMEIVTAFQVRRGAKELPLGA